MKTKIKIESLSSKECECKAILESLVFSSFNTALEYLNKINPLSILLLIKEISEDKYNVVNNIYQQIQSNDFLYSTVRSITSGLAIGDAIYNILNFIASDDNVYKMLQVYIKLNKIVLYSNILIDRLNRLRNIMLKLKNSNQSEKKSREKRVKNANVILKKVNSLLIQLNNTRDINSFYSIVNKLIRYIETNKNLICNINNQDDIPNYGLILELEAILIDIRNTLPLLLNYLNDKNLEKVSFVLASNSFRNPLTTLFVNLNRSLIAYAIDVVNNKKIPSYCLKLTLVLTILKAMLVPINVSGIQPNMALIKPLEICEDQLRALSQISPTAKSFYDRWLTAKTNGFVITPQFIRNEVNRLNKVISRIKQIKYSSKVEISKIEKSVKLNSIGYIDMVINNTRKVNQLALLGLNSAIFIIPCIALAIALYNTLFELALSVGKYIADAIEELITKPLDELLELLKTQNIVNIIAGIVNLAECYNLHVKSINIPQSIIDKIEKFEANMVATLYSKVKLLNFKVYDKILNKIGLDISFLKRILDNLRRIEEMMDVVKQIKDIKGIC